MSQNPPRPHRSGEGRRWRRFRELWAKCEPRPSWLHRYNTSRQLCNSNITRSSFSIYYHTCLSKSLTSFSCQRKYGTTTLCAIRLFFFRSRDGVWSCASLEGASQCVIQKHVLPCFAVSSHSPRKLFTWLFMGLVSSLCLRAEGESLFFLCSAGRAWRTVVRRGRPRTPGWFWVLVWVGQVMLGDHGDRVWMIGRRVWLLD